MFNRIRSLSAASAPPDPVVHIVMGDPLSTVFDVAILGTGLVESIVAAAAACAGRTVLHVDAATFYGGADASLPLPQFIEWAGGESGEHGEAAHDTPNGHSAEWASVRIQPLVQPSDVAPPPLPVAVAALARRFTIDFRPRLVLSRGAVVDLLVLSGVSQHVDFKAADAAYYVDAVAPRRLEVSKVRQRALLGPIAATRLTLPPSCAPPHNARRFPRTRGTSFLTRDFRCSRSTVLCASCRYARLWTPPKSWHRAPMRATAPLVP